MAETITAGGLDFFVENRRTGSDGGPSLQVLAGPENEKLQLLRFDMFHRQPHYHYAPNGKNIRYDLDPLTFDDGMGWAISLLRARLPQLLEKADYAGLTDEARDAALAALPQVEAAWRLQKPEEEAAAARPH